MSDINENVATTIGGSEAAPEEVNIEELAAQMRGAMELLALVPQAISRLELVAFPLLKWAFDTGALTPEDHDRLATALTNSRTLEEYWATDVTPD